MREIKLKVNRALSVLFAIAIIVTSMPQNVLQVSAAQDGGDDFIVEATGESGDDLNEGTSEDNADRVSEGTVEEPESIESKTVEPYIIDYKMDVEKVDGDTSEGITGNVFAADGDVDTVDFCFEIGDNIKLYDGDSEEPVDEEFVYIKSVGIDETFRMRFVADDGYVLSGDMYAVWDNDFNERDVIWKRIEGDNHDLIYEFYPGDDTYTSKFITIEESAMEVEEANTLTFDINMPEAELSVYKEEYDAKNRKYKLTPMALNADNSLIISNEYDVYFDIDYKKGYTIDRVDYSWIEEDEDGLTHVESGYNLTCEEPDPENPYRRTYYFGRVTDKNALCNIYGGEGCEITWNVPYVNITHMWKRTDDDDYTYYEPDETDDAEISDTIKFVRGEPWYFAAEFDYEKLSCPGDWYLTTTGDEKGMLSSIEVYEDLDIYCIIPDEDMTISSYIPGHTIKLVYDDKVEISDIQLFTDGAGEYATIISEDKKSILLYNMENEIIFTVKFPTDLDYMPYYILRKYAETWTEEEESVWVAKDFKMDCALYAREDEPDTGMTTAKFFIQDCGSNVVEIGMESDEVEDNKTLRFDMKNVSIYEYDGDDYESGKVLTATEKTFRRNDTFRFKLKIRNGYSLKSVKTNDMELNADSEGWYWLRVSDDMTLSVETEKMHKVTFNINNAEVDVDAQNEYGEDLYLGGSGFTTGVTDVANDKYLRFYVFPMTGYEIKYVTTDGTEQGALTKDEVKGFYNLKVTGDMTIDIVTQEATYETHKIEIIYDALAMDGEIELSGIYACTKEFLSDGMTKDIYAVPKNNKEHFINMFVPQVDTHYDFVKCTINDTDYNITLNASNPLIKDEDMSEDYTIKFETKGKGSVTYDFNTNEHVKIYDETGTTLLTSKEIEYGSREAFRIKAVADERFIISGVRLSNWSNVNIVKIAGDNHAIIYEISPKTSDSGSKCAHVEDITATFSTMGVITGNSLKFCLNMTGAKLTVRAEKYDADKGYYFETLAQDVSDSTTITISNEYRIYFDVDYREGSAIEKVECVLDEDNPDPITLEPEEIDPDYPNRRTYDYGFVTEVGEICTIHGGAVCNVTWTIPSYMHVYPVDAIPEKDEDTGETNTNYQQTDDEVSESLTIPKGKSWFFTISSDIDVPISVWANNIELTNRGPNEDLQNLYIITPSRDMNVECRAVRNVPVMKFDKNVVISEVSFEVNTNKEYGDDVLSYFDKNDNTIKYFPFIEDTANITVNFPIALEYEPYYIYTTEDDDNYGEMKDVTAKIEYTSYSMNTGTGIVTATFSVVCNDSLKEIGLKTLKTPIEKRVAFKKNNASVYVYSISNEDGELLPTSNTINHIQDTILCFRVVADNGYNISYVTADGTKEGALTADKDGWYSVKVPNNMTISVVTEKIEDPSESEGSSEASSEESKPSEASSEASQPSEASSESSSEASKPSEASSESSSEASKPSEAGSESSSEASKPSEAGSEASSEASKPSEAGSEASSEASKPSEAGSEASSEASKPSEAGSEASSEASKPSEASSEYSSEESRPSEASSEASGEASQPSESESSSEASQPTTPEVADKGMVVYFVGEDGKLVKPNEYSVTYNGAAIKPLVRVYNNRKELTEGTDYSVKYKNNTNATSEGKEALVTVTGKGSFSGTANALKFTIKPAVIGEDVSIPSAMTVAVNTKVAPVLMCGDKKLGAKDFKMSGDGLDAKYKYASVTADGVTNKLKVTAASANYTGEATIKVKVVEKKALGKLKVKIDSKAAKNVTFDGQSHSPADLIASKVIIVNDGLDPTSEDGTENYKIVCGSDTVNAGTVKFTIVGCGTYGGSVAKSYKINPADKNGTFDIKVKDNVDTVEYRATGAKLPGFEIRFKATETDTLDLMEGRDYKVAYSSNKKVGTGKYTITFLNNYKGCKPAAAKNTFTIKQAVANADNTVVVVPDKAYGKAGKAYKSTPIVMVNGELVKSSNYAVHYAWKSESAAEYTKDDKVKVTIAGEDKYAKVKVTVNFNSKPKGSYKQAEGDTTPIEGTYYVRNVSGATDLSKAKVTFKDYKGNVIKNLEYNGKEYYTPDGNKFDAAAANDDPNAVYVEVAVKGASVSEELYTVTWTNSTEKGKATVVINGTGKPAERRAAAIGSKNASISIKAMNLKGKDLTSVLQNIWSNIF